MSNVLILSENEVFKLDLADQIKHHIPDFEVTEDREIADIIVVDEKISLLKSLEKYVIIHQVDLNDAPQKEKLIKKYLSKGFNYNLIKDVLEEIWKN